MWYYLSTIHTHGIITVVPPNFPMVTCVALCHWFRWGNNNGRKRSSSSKSCFFAPFVRRSPKSPARLPLLCLSLTRLIHITIRYNSADQKKNEKNVTVLGECDAAHSQSTDLAFTCSKNVMVFSSVPPTFFFPSLFSPI
jgi:hypothetical protein